MDTCNKIVYQCKDCGIFGHKLWRYAATFKLELQCIRCIEAETGERLPFSQGGLDMRRKAKDWVWLQFSDQIAGRVPAVPDFESCDFWGYTSVPEEMCKWWLNLPL